MLKTVATARHAMATRFEIVLHGDDEHRLRAAAEEALDEIQRLEAQLSLYRNSSDVFQINTHAAIRPVRIEPQLFHLLLEAGQLHRESGGTFDITVGPLMRCWGFLRDTGRLPASDLVAEARRNVGMNLIELDEDAFTIRFLRAGVMLDLGSIGKGYALERAANLLREAGVASAILHGGTSTVCTIGAPPDAAAWTVAIDDPRTAGSSELSVGAGVSERKLLATIPLKDESLSVSAVWGKSFQVDGKTYGHVIDPRSGFPVNNAVLAAVVLPSATESDAFSTALLTLGAEGLGAICSRRDKMKALVIAPVNTGEFTISTHGIELLSPGW